jgi:hypothetical protein
MIRFAALGVTLCAVILSSAAVARAQDLPGGVEYRVLATNKTSTMQKEMTEAAEAGFRFGGMMGGETSFGGQEVVVVMTKEGRESGRYAYRLLATNKTSTMLKELQEASDAGFEFLGQSVFSSAFGGKEVVVVLERGPEPDPLSYEYRLLATKKTATLQKELSIAGQQGFQFVGLTVADTATAGNEIVAILRRQARPR